MKLYVIQFDMDRWFDLYDSLPETVKECVSEFSGSCSPDGYTTPIIDGNPKLALFREGMNEYPDLWTLIDVTDKYVIMETTAPASYDGFSTFQIADDGRASIELLISKSVRIIATMHRDLYWQQMRYCSGACWVKRLDGKPLETP